MACVYFLSLLAISDHALELNISSTLSIEFFKPQLIADTEWPDKFVLIEPGFIAGDLGSATFIANRTLNSTQWTQAYTHSDANPAIGYAFPINTSTITNLGTFTAIPSNATATNLTSHDFDWFQKANTGSLSHTEDTTDQITFTGLPYGISNSKFVKGLRFELSKLERRRTHDALVQGLRGHHQHRRGTHLDAAQECAANGMRQAETEDV